MTNSTIGALSKTVNTGFDKAARGRGLLRKYYQINLKNQIKQKTYIDDWYHANPSRLKTAEPMLKTSEEYQKASTAELLGADAEICRVVAVTLEKKVEMVVIAVYLFTAFSSRSRCTYGSAVTAQITR